MTSNDEEGIAVLQKHLDINFANKELLKQALTHSTTLSQPRNLRSGDNEALATLGDAVLSLVVATDLYQRSKDISTFITSAKGDLTIDRSRLVRGVRLEALAKRIHLDKYLLVSPGQAINTKVLAQAYEALIGALLLDSGYEKAMTFVRTFVIQSSN